MKDVPDTVSLSVIRWTLTFVLALSLTVAPGAQSEDLAARKRSAELAMRAGRFDEAATILERAVAAQPSDIETRWLLADAYLAAGRQIDAVSALLEVTERAPKFPGGWYALGRVYNAVKQGVLDTFGEWARGRALAATARRRCACSLAAS